MAEPLTAKQLLEERAPLAHQIKEFNDKIQAEGRVPTAEEDEQWGKMNRDYDLYTKRIELAHRAETIIKQQVTALDEQERAQGGKEAAIPGREDFNGRQVAQEVEEAVAKSQGPNEEQRALAIQAWMRAQRGLELKPEHQRACELTGIRPYAYEMSLPLRRDSYDNVRREWRAQSAFDGSAGNYTAAQGFMANLERALLQFGGMRQVADVMRTTSGNEMPWPTNNDSGNTGAIIGENTAATELNVTFGQTVFRSYKWTSRLILVPYELMEDSAFDLAAFLGSALGERIGRIQNAHFTTGTGTGQPRGVVTACAATAAAVISSNTANSIQFDDIIDLIHGVDPAYRSMGTVMAHDTVLSTVRKLKDGQGKYLWEPSTQLGQPDRIWGYPVVTNQQMASTTTTGSNSMLFGDFSKYKIRDVGEIRFKRLMERYGESDQEGFVAFARGDGNLLDAGTNPIHVLQIS